MFYSLLCLCPWGKPLYRAPKQDITEKAGEKEVCTEAVQVMYLSVHIKELMPVP